MYKEKIRNLMEENKDDPDVLEFIESRVNSFIDYVQYVSFAENRMVRLKAEGVRFEDWRDATASLDESRHHKHEVVIGAVRQLNRLSESCGLEVFYGGPTDDAHRYEVGSMCKQIVNEYFDDRDMAKSLAISQLAGDDFAMEVDKLSEAAKAMEL